MVGDKEIIQDPVTEKIIQSVIKVHRTLGPGYLESIYRKALFIELRRSGHRVEIERELVVTYEGIEVGRYRLDLVVDGLVVVEAKAVDSLVGTHYAQLRSYLRAARLSIGLLVNFAKERADFRRVEMLF